MDEEKLTEKLTALEGCAASNTRRIEGLERGQAEIRKLTSAVQVLAVRQSGTAKSVGEIGEKLDALAQKPQTRWEGIADKLIVAAASIVIGWLLSSMGFGA